MRLQGFNIDRIVHLSSFGKLDGYRYHSIYTLNVSNFHSEMQAYILNSS